MFLFYLGSQTAVHVGRASLILYFALIDSVAAGLAAVSGLLDSALMLLTTLSLPALFVGQAIGTRLFRSPLQQYYRVVAVVVLGIVSTAVLVQSAMIFGAASQAAAALASCKPGRAAPSEPAP